MSENEIPNTKYRFEVEFISNEEWITWCDLLRAILESEDYRERLKGKYLSVKLLSKEEDDEDG